MSVSDGIIWLIGCNGMLGTEIARQLTEQGLPFTGTDREVDITDPAALEAFAEGKHISWIINCSAYTAVDKAELEPLLAALLNESGPRNIAAVAKKTGARLIHISTDYVFDGKGTSPYTEDMPVQPIGVYGVTKAAGEAAVQEVLPDALIVRTAWLYGWAGKNFVYTMIRAMNARGAVKVVNDQRGTPTFAGDLAGTLIRMVQAGNVPGGVYHCTDLGEISWYDFAVAIEAEARKAGYITREDVSVSPCATTEYPTPAERPAYSVLSKEKIQKTLGITLPEWRDSLRIFLESPLFDNTKIQ